MTVEVSSTTLLDLMVGMGNANFDLGGGYPALIIGEKGIGKTELMKTLAKRLEEERGKKVNVVFLYLSTQDTADLVGMPYIDKENNQTRYARPEWFPPIDSEEDWIVVCDEYNRAPVYVQQTMLPFSVEGKLHTHTMPKNHMVAFLCNPASDDYHVTHFADEAFYDRMLRMSYAPTMDEWLNYAETHGVAQCVINTAIKLQEKMITQNYVAADNLPQVIPSNRTWDKVGRLIEYFGKEWIESHGDSLIAGYVGTERAIPVMQEFRNALDKVLKPKEILYRLDEADVAWLTKNTTVENYEAGKIAEMNLGLRRYIVKNIDKVMNNEEDSLVRLGTYLSFIGDDQIVEFNNEIVSLMELEKIQVITQRDLLCNLNKKMNNSYHERTSGRKLKEDEIKEKIVEEQKASKAGVSPVSEYVNHPWL